MSQRTSKRLESMYKNKIAQIITNIGDLMDNITIPDYDKAESSEEYKEMFIKKYVQMNKIYTYINDNMHTLSKLSMTDTFLKTAYTKSFDFLDDIAFLHDSEKLNSPRQLKIADDLKKKLVSYRKLYKNYVEKKLWFLKGRVNTDLVLDINSYL